MEVNCSKGNSYKVSSQSTPTNGTMTAKRELCCAQLVGVALFCSGLVGGILIGIYVYHGGPDTEVLCKNLPEALAKLEGSTPAQAQTTTTTGGHVVTTRSPESPSMTTKAPVDMPSTPSANTCKPCDRREPRTVWDGEDPEIFAPLTSQEMTKAYNFLLDNGYIFRRNPEEPLTLKSNYVPYMYLFLPNKEEVLDYKDGIGPHPGRHARVHIVRGNQTVPDYMEFKIGPLEEEYMTIEPLYENGELVFNSRPYDYVETAVYEQLLVPDMKILEPLTKESFDGAYFPRENNDFAFWFFNGPPGYRAKDRETRFLAYLNPLAPNGFDVLELDFLPLTGTIHCPGNTVEDWYVYDYYYLNQGPFNNATALLKAYESGSIRKFALPNGYRGTILDRHLPDREPNQPFRKYSNMAPPRTYEPNGPRYTIKGHNVDWMDWNFDVSSGQLRGPGIYSITFKGMSIAYEISLNEIGVIYGSGASAQTNIIYTDSSYGIGEFYGIIHTVDCPSHAALLETSHWDVYQLEPVVHKSICVFEADGENALWRHKGWDFEGGLRNNYLVVRASATIDNYDYIIEWHFYLDGKVYTIVSASGYIQGAFWDHENPFMGADRSRDAFGYRVNRNTHGQIHDHMFGFKVDLDILGTNNTMETIHWKTADVATALRSQVPTVNEVPPYFKHNITRYIEYEYVERETAYRISLDDPKFWVVVNENERNKWGAERGYQIKPLTTAAQTVTDNHPAMPALSFTKYHCTVTKRKEAEQYLTSTSDVNRLDNPIGDIEKMLDNEYIRNTDIVNWVSVGFLHLPTAEDSPMTDRVESGFLIKPFNFFNSTPVFDLQGYLNTRNNWRTERPPAFEPCLERNP